MIGSLREAGVHSRKSLQDQASYNYRVGGNSTTFTNTEANDMGRAWVGPGYRVTSAGSYESADGLRLYRPPVLKPNLGVTQANIQQRLVPTGSWERANGHIYVE